MSVNFEIKGMLAKLLSTEDIIVENKKVDTACFNVETRVLTLPLWERASDSIYTMLVLHEISHARWTPNIDWSKDHNVPGQYVNIVEDVRVEKLCKKKYLGSSKSFFNGYKELQEQDFFCIGEDDHNTYSLADRVNLYFKVGNFIDIQFNEEEQNIVELIASTETFDDALNAAKVLYEYCKKEKEQQESVDVNFNQTNNPSGSSTESSDFQQSQEGENDADETPNEQQPQGKQSSDLQDGNEGGKVSTMGNNEEPEVKTVDKLSESIRELIGNNQFYENVYVEVPKVNLDKIVIPNAEIHKVCTDYWANYMERNEYNETIFTEVDSNYNNFKKSAQKEVNYLVKEFECRKAADSYSRATTARTGVLDCSKLHTYKFNDDLFLKVTTLAEGKNHGLVFVLDWSGSMSNVMMDTIKQLYNLIWFCRKVSIPFEVYAFTNHYPRVRYNDEGKSELLTDSYERRDGTLYIEEWFSMMNLLTSKVNNSVLDKQMKNIYRIANCFRNSYGRYDIPSQFSLSGTPLNDAIYSLHQILPKFKSDNKLQKVQCVILTDGEGNAPKRNILVERIGMEPYMGTNYIGPNCFLRDRKSGHTYRLDGNHDKVTDIFLQNLRDSFTDMNFIGIRILESRDAGYFMRKYNGSYGKEFEKVNNSWRKEKSFVIKNSGYHSYFALSASILNNDAEFEVADDATKSQIKNAFAKSLKNKKMNKKILGEFISLVA